MEVLLRSQVGLLVSKTKKLPKPIGSDVIVELALLGTHISYAFCRFYWRWCSEIPEVSSLEAYVFLFQKISNRTHWTDPWTWVSNSSIATYLGSVGIRSHSIFVGFIQPKKVAEVCFKRPTINPSTPNVWTINHPVWTPGIGAAHRRRTGALICLASIWPLMLGAKKIYTPVKLT